MLRLASLTSVLLLVGCANQGDEGMSIRNITAVGATCVLTGAASQPFISHGQIHALSPNGYFLTPLIESRVTAVEGIDPIQKTIQLRSADIRLTLKAATIETSGRYTTKAYDKAYPGFSQLFSGALSPGGTVNVGFDIIPPGTLRQILADTGANVETDTLNAEVLAEITIRGDLGGDEILSSAFFFPVSVCTGCITVNNGTCPMAISAPRTGNACNVFQDGIVDCCVDATNRLVCPGSTM